MGVIKAFERMKDDGTYNGNLVLAGMPGSGHEMVDEYVKNSKWKKNIVMTGFVTDEELIALYSTCKVFCFLSLYEGFGIPPLEALSCGANVVVSNTSSLPEVVGDVGITVDPMNEDDVIDGIKRSIYQNKEKYMEEVTEHLKKYDWKNLSKEFEKVFEC